MEETADWEKLVRRMELLLRLKSFPVALKMLEKKEALGQIPFLRRPQGKKTLCQLITLVRNFDWTVGAEADDFLSPMCGSIIGLNDTPEIYKDGTFRSIVWVKTKEDGQKYETGIPRLPLGRYEAIAMAPLVYKPFVPDLVLIYANPAQMILLINALQFEEYEVMQFFCVGESSCADAIARGLLSGKPALTIPCYGERRYGHAQDEDLVMAVPTGMMEKALRGLEALYKRGIRYPISYAGTEQDLSSAFPLAYGGIHQLETLRGQDHRLLLAVTGGIATGKSTVTRMFKELGVPVIDFDLIAREVVEPEKPAWQDIVAYFGQQVLLEDNQLDRKKISGIVFSDMEKRKRLEGFTHPRIQTEFIRQLNEIVEKDPEAIILVDVPLLVELNMQYMFHKTLVVFTSRERQIERLLERDGISREEAATRLKAQLPIEEKVGYADFIIDNNGSLEETRQQVQDLLLVLKAIQNERAR
jgi:dephospho-CoA kinase